MPDTKNIAGCDACAGDLSVFWKDENNNAFVDSKGEMEVMVNGHVMTFTVQHCPVCGRSFGTMTASD